MPKIDILKTTVTVSTEIGKSIAKRLFKLAFVVGVAGALCVVGLTALVAAIIK